MEVRGEFSAQAEGIAVQSHAGSVGGQTDVVVQDGQGQTGGDGVRLKRKGMEARAKELGRFHHCHW
jgi:hypothetical protein